MGFPYLNKPKRSLGQNFFVNLNLGIALIEKSLETNPQKVIEIGGGRGFFTKILVEKNVDVVVIEKDGVLSENLKFLFSNIQVYNEDIFSKNVLPLFKENSSTVCFGSLPYNISKKIISYVAVNSNIENFYFIIQKEVAQKYASKEKSSMLSVTNKIYFNTEIVFDIAPENFKPKPNVVSCFVKFSRNENLKLIGKVEEFLKYLHKAFKQPRKMLKNNLEKHYTLNSDISKFLKKRAEDLSFEEHLNLFKSLVV